MFFEDRIPFPVDFLVLVVVGDIVPSAVGDFPYRYFPLRLLLVEISRSTPPRELVGPLCGFARMKVYLSCLIRYCLSASW